MPLVKHCLVSIDISESLFVLVKVGMSTEFVNFFFYYQIKIIPCHSENLAKNLVK